MFARSGPTPKNHACPDDQTLYKFYLRLLHPKAITEKAAERFFLLMLVSSLIFEMPISGGSAKGQWCHTYF
jgi:hypothetical protein